MRWRCCLLIGLVLLCWCIAFSHQQTGQAGHDDYEEFNSDEESFEGMDEIMKEMEAMAELEIDSHELNEAPLIESEAHNHGPTSPPSFVSASSKSTDNIKSDKDTRHSTMDYLQSKRKASKKRSQKKRSPSENSESIKSPPVAAGGAYYGGDINREKKEAFKQQQQKQTSSKSGTSKIRTNKMSSMSSNRFEELENQLSETVRINMAFAEKQQSDREQKKHERHTRFKIPRRYAAPVERVISIYDDVKTDLYMVLKVPRNADEFTLKRQYRTLALQLHPDKNPHPDAKAAFDAIQDAYDVLANPTKRQEYDKELRKLARARAWTLKKFKLKIHDMLHNLSAQILLIWYQYRRGEVVDDLVQWKNNWKQRFSEIAQFFEHLYLLPSFADKMQLLQEVGSRHLLPLILLISLVPSVRFFTWRGMTPIENIPIHVYNI